MNINLFFHELFFIFIYNSIAIVMSNTKICMLTKYIYKIFKIIKRDWRV